jgi:hypothetical protein
MRAQPSGGSGPLAAPQLNPFQPFPQAGGLEQSLFPPNSRYHTLHTLSLERDDKQVAYLERRFLPDPATLDELHEHTVVQEDRIDNLAYKYLGDPELAWRIADANLALIRAN